MLAVEFRTVTKRFRRRSVTANYGTLKALLAGAQRLEAPPPIEALRDVSFQTAAGETLAVIGRNGSGKTTLLKVAAGIYRPDLGTVRTTGRRVSLIELGLGLHPDFTGRENVMVIGLLHGLTRRELRDQFDRIVEFAGIDGFIDEPVRTYSSGMCMRLGFAAAIHSAPEILLIDEVFAVGDGLFVDKCIAWMERFQRSGGTIVVASHDLSLVRQRCDHALWLDGGQVRAIGDAREVADAYIAWMANNRVVSS
ncbi:MAG TPA: ABC transporter ATP-binding protein [Candidatus Binatia bacterium]|nr:ABC transporter ATP-binding protein [Candidatus Binatia bacterium]